MSKGLYPIERRTGVLARLIPQTIDAMAARLATPGGRIPFTTQMSRDAALDFWEANLSKPAGTDAYNALPAQNQIDLQNALAERIAARQMGQGVSNGIQGYS